MRLSRLFFTVTTFSLLAFTTVVFNLQPAEFSKKLKSTKGAVLIDVRTKEEFAEGHLQGAKNIDWNGSDFEGAVEKISKTKPCFVYCLSGGRSAAAAQRMRKLGFEKVYELSGGITAWKKANLPTTTK